MLKTVGGDGAVFRTRREQTFTTDFGLELSVDLDLRPEHVGDGLAILILACASDRDNDRERRRRNCRLDESRFC